MAEILAGIEEEVRATEGLKWKELLLPANRKRVLITFFLQVGSSDPESPPYLRSSTLTDLKVFK